MSRTLGANCGSLLNLNDSTRCGCSLCFFPDPLHGSRTDLLAGRHSTHAPMGSILGRRLHRGFHDRCLPLLRNPFGTATAGPILKDPRHALALVPLAPQQHRGQGGGQVARQNVVGHSLRSTEDDVHAKSHSPRRAAMTANAQKLSAFRIRKDQPGGGGKRHISVCPQLDY